MSRVTQLADGLDLVDHPESGITGALLVQRDVNLVLDLAAVILALIPALGDRKRGCVGFRAVANLYEHELPGRGRLEQLLEDVIPLVLRVRPARTAAVDDHGDFVGAEVAQDEIGITRGPAPVSYTHLTLPTSDLV